MSIRREQIDNLRQQLNVACDRDGASVTAIAFTMNVPADELRRFLKTGDDAGLGARVRQFIADRNARWDRIVGDESGEALEAAIREHSSEMAEVLKGLTDWAPAEVAGNAEIARQVGLMHLNSLRRLFALCDGPGTCWRCGANIKPPPAEVEVQIAINETSAAWQAWPPEVFGEKLREVMQRGDRIVGIRAGAIVLRRANGALLEVSRWDG